MIKNKSTSFKIILSSSFNLKNDYTSVNAYKNKLLNFFSIYKIHFCRVLGNPKQKKGYYTYYSKILKTEYYIFGIKVYTKKYES